MPGEEELCLCVGKEENDSGVGGRTHIRYVGKEGDMTRTGEGRKGLWQVCWKGRSHHRCVELEIMTGMLERVASYHTC